MFFAVHGKDDLTARIYFRTRNSVTDHVIEFIVFVNGSDFSKKFVFGLFETTSPVSRTTRKDVPFRHTAMGKTSIGPKESLFGDPKPMVSIEVQCRGNSASTFPVELVFRSLGLKMGSSYHCLAKCGTTQQAHLQKVFKIDPSKIDLTAVFFFGKDDTFPNLRDVILRVNDSSYVYPIVFLSKERFIYSDIEDSFYKIKTIDILRVHSPFRILTGSTGNRYRPAVYIVFKCVEGTKLEKKHQKTYQFFLTSYDLNEAFKYSSSAKCNVRKKARITYLTTPTQIDY